MVKMSNNHIGKICYRLKDLLLFQKLWGHYLEEKLETKDNRHSSTSSGKNIKQFYWQNLLLSQRIYMQPGIIIRNQWRLVAKKTRGAASDKF